MARPRKAEIGKAAIVRIENAFWSLLERESFSKITVRLISQESGTNRNSFYYHYADINDLAEKAFRNNADDETSRVLIATLLSNIRGNGPDRTSGRDGNAAFSPEFIARSRRIMICAGSDSPFLRSLVIDMLKKIWLDAFSIKDELLSDSEKLEIDFIFAGLVAILGSAEIRKTPLKMLTLAQTDMGRASMAALKKISDSQK